MIDGDRSSRKDVLSKLELFYGRKDYAQKKIDVEVGSHSVHLFSRDFFVLSLRSAIQPQTISLRFFMCSHLSG